MAAFSTKLEFLVRKTEKMEVTQTGNEETGSYNQGEVGRLKTQ